MSQTPKEIYLRGRQGTHQSSDPVEYVPAVVEVRLMFTREPLCGSSSPSLSAKSEARGYNDNPLKRKLREVFPDAAESDLRESGMLEVELQRVSSRLSTFSVVRWSLLSESESDGLLIVAFLELLLEVVSLPCLVSVIK